MSKRSYRQFIGIPFRAGGRDFSGVDCYGLIVLVYKTEGVKLWDTSDYNLENHTHASDNLMLSNYSRNWIKIDKDEVEELDILLFNMDLDLPDIPTHVALYVGDNEVIHCMSGHPVYRCKFKKGPLERFFQGAYRYKWH